MRMSMECGWIKILLKGENIRRINQNWGIDISNYAIEIYVCILKQEQNNKNDSALCQTYRLTII